MVINMGIKSIQMMKLPQMMKLLPNINRLVVGLIISVVSLVTPCIRAQGEEFDLLGEAPISVEKVNYAFKTTKVINLQSLELTDYGVLDFKMMHRFGALNSGAVNAFGLDQASVRFGLEYGITHNLMISMGRSNVNGIKNADAFLKYRMIHQNSDNSKPFSLLWLVGVQYGLVNPLSSYFPTPEERCSYVLQSIIGRKFSEKFSLQFSPTFIANAYNSRWTQPGFATQNIWALGIGSRYKITQRTAFNFEYIPILTSKGNVYNSLSVGLDLETGGHVFQFQLTNSAGLNETQFIANTKTQWNNAGVRLGFNLSRVFTIIK